MSNFGEGTYGSGTFGQTKTARILRLSVNDPNEKDCFNLLISGSKFNLVELLFELEEDEHQYLLEALDQARALQREGKDPTEELLGSLIADLSPEEKQDG